MKAFQQQLLTELRLYTRSVGSLAWSFIFPIFVIFGLGFYFGSDQQEKQFIGVVDEDQSIVSRTFVGLLDSRQSQFVIGEGSMVEVDSMLKDGKLSAWVKIPAGFSDATVSGAAQVQYKLNPYLVQPGTVLPLFIEYCISGLNNALISGRTPVVLALLPNGENGTESNSTYVDFLIPGMIGLQVMSACLWGIGFLLINYREKGNLKQLALTPVRKSVYIGALIGSRFVFQMLQVLFILVCSYFAFEIHNQGNWVSFFVVLTLGMLMFMALGFLIASLAGTIELAIGINNIIFFLMIGFGGVFFSTSNFPEWMQWATGLFPLTHFITALRGIFTEGHSLLMYGMEIVILSVWMLICFALSVRYFRWY